MLKLPLSVCIISGAEAHRIGRALASVAGRAQEIVVVLNQEVQDGTEAICLAQGAKVYREPWQGYVAQKNSVAEKASQPWLFSLDADEEVPPALWTEMASAIEAADRDPSAADVAFEFPRCTNYCGRWIRHGDWYPDRVLRVWRKGSAVWTGIGIHERLEVNGTVGRLHADLLHHSIQDINRHLDKIGRYADPFVDHCRATGRSASWLDLLVRPIWKFFRGYVLRLGFLDGWQGYYIAWVGAFATLTRYAKVREAEVPSPTTKRAK